MLSLALPTDGSRYRLKIRKEYGADRVNRSFGGFGAGGTGILPDIYLLSICEYLPDITDTAITADIVGIADIGLCRLGLHSQNVEYLEDARRRTEALTNESTCSEKVLCSRADISPVRTTHV